MAAGGTRKERKHPRVIPRDGTTGAQNFAASSTNDQSINNLSLDRCRTLPVCLFAHDPDAGADENRGRTKKRDQLELLHLGTSIPKRSRLGSCQSSRSIGGNQNQRKRAVEKKFQRNLVPTRSFVNQQ